MNREDRIILITMFRILVGLLIPYISCELSIIPRDSAVILVKGSVKLVEDLEELVPEWLEGE